MQLLLALKYTRTIFKDLALPPSCLLLLGLVGLLLLRRMPRLGRTLIAVCFASVWLLSTPLIADGLSALVEHYPPLDLTQPTQAQAIVILGGGNFRDFAPEYGGPDAEPYMLERLAYGTYVSRRTALPILVTGWQHEPLAMQATLSRQFQIEARWVDDQSYDTFENARNSARILRAAGISRVILITRATHLWRGTQEFEAAGMQVVPAPSGSLTERDRIPFRYIPDPGALMRSHDAIYEMLGDLERRFLTLSHLRRH